MKIHTAAPEAFRAIDKPASVRPMPPGMPLTADQIDYAAHPAYAGYAKAGPIDRASAIARFAGKFAVLVAKRAVRYEMIPRTLRSPRSLADRIGFVRHAFWNLVTPARQSATVATSAEHAELADEMARDGVIVVAMPPSRLDELNRLAATQFDALAARRGASAGGREFDESRAAADPRDETALYDFLNRLFAEAGIFEVARAYTGRTLRLIDVNPQINDVSDSFWQDIFPDREGETLPKTAYFHRDASGGDLKAIVYCTDVGPTNGPFTYSVGSNRLAISRADDLLREANDHNGLSATEPAARRRFAALPARWRQKGSFGNDLPDSAPLSQTIVDSAWAIEGPAGSIVLFDTKGIHRGGMVQDGERRVITCVLG